MLLFCVETVLADTDRQFRGKSDDAQDMAIVLLSSETTS